jgi:chromosomal replication initiation ATPase DnaA
MHMPGQLPLTLPHSPQYGRDEFIVGPSNDAALKVVEKWPDGSSPLAVLGGPPGSGKTHLVHIWAMRTGADILSADDLSPEDPPQTRMLAVENLRPGSIPEAALFHLINSAKERNGSLLLTSRSVAEDWRIALPDLRSRLRMATPIWIGAPDDDLLRKVLVKLFADRQLIVEKPVIDYLLLRMERSLAAAVSLVEALDRAALAAGRSITRPMAAQILAEEGAPEAFADRQ